MQMQDLYALRVPNSLSSLLHSELRSPTHSITLSHVTNDIYIFQLNSKKYKAMLFPLPCIAEVLKTKSRKQFTKVRDLCGCLFVFDGEMDVNKCGLEVKGDNNVNNETNILNKEMLENEIENSNIVILQKNNSAKEDENVNVKDVESNKTNMQNINSKVTEDNNDKIVVKKFDPTNEQIELDKENSLSKQKGNQLKDAKLAGGEMEDFLKHVTDRNNGNKNESNTMGKTLHENEMHKINKKLNLEHVPINKNTMAMHNMRPLDSEMSNKRVKQSPCTMLQKDRISTYMTGEQTPTLVKCLKSSGLSPGLFLAKSKLFRKRSKKVEDAERIEAKVRELLEKEKSANKVELIFPKEESDDISSMAAEIERDLVKNQTFNEEKIGKINQKKKELNEVEEKIKIKEEQLKEVVNAIVKKRFNDSLNVLKESKDKIVDELHKLEMES